MATVPAAGPVAPSAEGTAPTHAAPPVLAVGAGSPFFAHVSVVGTVFVLLLSTVVQATLPRRRPYALP